MIAALAIKSLRNRKFTAALTVLSITLAVLLLLGVERIRTEAREGFASTISGTDLIVGARSSPVHLLLCFGVPHRQRDQQRPLGQYRALAAVRRLRGPFPSPWATRTADIG